jgi:hypothetical protein
MRVLASRLRVAAAVAVTTLLGACTGGINAGEEGGRAFIAFTGMLIVTIAILYYFLGRED